MATMCMGNFEDKGLTRDRRSFLSLAILSNYGFVFHFPQRPLGRALRVVRHGARLRAGGTIPDVLAWPSGASAGGPFSAGAGLAKAVFAITTTRALIERLATFGSEATFSRAFGPSALSSCGIIWLTSRRFELKGARNRRRSRSNRPETAARSSAQGRATAQGAAPPGAPVADERRFDDLPRAADVGVKQGAKGHRESWRGYKLHIDAADGGIPLSCILTSASLHDSQAAIPLATMTGTRVSHLSRLDGYSALGHIIDVNPRSGLAGRRQRPSAALATSPEGALP